MIRFATTMAGNAGLFTALDLAQTAAEHFEFGTILTNLLAAIIATSLGLGVTFAGKAMGAAHA